MNFFHFSILIIAINKLCYSVKVTGTNRPSQVVSAGLDHDTSGCGNRASYTGKSYKCKGGENKRFTRQVVYNRFTDRHGRDMIYAPRGNLTIFYKPHGYVTGLIKSEQLDEPDDLPIHPAAYSARIELLTE